MAECTDYRCFWTTFSIISRLRFDVTLTLKKVLLLQRLDLVGGDKAEINIFDEYSLLDS
jgi:hypothetical protein